MLHFLSSFQVILRRTHFSKELKNTSIYANLPCPIPAILPTAYLLILLSVTGASKKALNINRFQSILFMAFTLFLRNVEDNLRSLCQ